MVPRSFSSEFPNDNAGLHLGTVWMSEEPCGPAVAHLPDGACADLEPIEIVDTIEITDPVEIVPAPEPLEVAPALATILPPPLEVDAPEPEPIAAPLESGDVATILAAELAAEANELDAVSANENGVPLASTPPDAPEDPYRVLLRALLDTAEASGESVGRAVLELELAQETVAVAWAAILRGQSEDFSLCSTPLDEWASQKLASLVGAPHKAAQMRRELRSRGVAAFGLIEAA